MVDANAVLDGIIVLETVIILYKLLQPSPSQFKTADYKREKVLKEKGLSEVKATAMKRLNSLLDVRGRITREISDAKKRYMAGEITYEAMRIIEAEGEGRIDEVDLKLAEFEGAY